MLCLYCEIEHHKFAARNTSSRPPEKSLAWWTDFFLLYRDAIPTALDESTSVSVLINWYINAVFGIQNQKAFIFYTF